MNVVSKTFGMISVIWKHIDDCERITHINKLYAYTYGICNMLKNI